MTPARFTPESLPPMIARGISVSDTPCWVWNGATTNLGYGQMRRSGVTLFAHRVVYETLIGTIPEGYELDHLCRVRCCVNPAHLEPVTHAENVRRGLSPSALNARATECRRGHAFTPENTYVTPNGWRRCRACKRDRGRIYDAARRSRGRVA